MIREQARIVALREGRMVLEPVNTGCGSCGKASGCGTARLASWLPSARRSLNLPAVPGARIGEVLEVGLPETALLVAALTAYLPPLLGLVLGALAITPAGEALQPLGAALGTLAGLAVSRLSGRLLAHRMTPVPVAAAAASDRPILTLTQEFHHD
ncbi:MAG: SoxR reducing system RseC family protein [Rhodocyclaceae bacterium]|nr:SoxR reducing system RseC family protein [Rhodocyclaceae bacterium]